MRYVVVGTSGSGKSTFARELAHIQGAAYVELDGLHWGRDWTPRVTDVFVAAVSDATQSERWVVDGNYSVTRDLVWPRATHIVWLNFRRSVVFTRVVRRTLGRIARRETLWEGNRESLRRAFLSRQSILLWSWQTHGTNRRKYAALRDSPQWSHLRWIELRTPREARAFLRDAHSLPIVA